MDLLPKLMDPEPVGVPARLVVERLRDRCSPEAFALASWLSERLAVWRCPQCGSTAEPSIRYTPPDDHFMLSCADESQHETN